jgi:hypothetical protein
MRKMCTKMVPKNLNYYQKICLEEMSAEMLEQLKAEPDFLDQVIIVENIFFPPPPPKYGP